MKKSLKKIILRVFGEWITNKLMAVWNYLSIVHKLYIRNSEPVFVSTKHPILSISSDDWGSVFLKSNGIGESAEEIKSLAKVLKQNKDSSGRPAVLNVYITTTLPDFESIAKSGFEKYIFYPTYRDRPDIVKAWLEGCESGVFRLGFHGRDHFNQKAWLEYLQNDYEYFLQGFHKGKVRYREGGQKIMKQMPELQYFAREYVDAITFPSTPISLNKQSQIIIDGVTIFKDMFGFRPKVFVASGYCFDEITGKAVLNNKMFYIETSLEQTIAVDNNGHSVSRRLRWGEKLAGGITVLIRNAHYEPDWCQLGWGESNKESMKANQKIALMEIKRAFRRGEPCVLSTHAQNYVGKSEKVTLNLKGLDALLSQIITQWPDVYFLSAEELGELVFHSKKDKSKKSSLISSLFWTMYDFFSLVCTKESNVPITII